MQTINKNKQGFTLIKNLEIQLKVAIALKAVFANPFKRNNSYPINSENTKTAQYKNKPNYYLHLDE